MATVKPPEESVLWSSAAPMPDDLTPSEIRIIGRITMLRDEMRIAFDRISEEFSFKNVYTPILALNSLGIVVLLIKAFV